MGSCVSVHKGSSQSGMGLKESVESLGNAKAQASPSVDDCQEDMFVDSNLSFESDCENFVSVSDDFSPSHDISPLPQNGSLDGATLVKFPLVVGTYDSISHSSPPAENKKLVELLHNSAGGNQSDNEQRLQDSNGITCSERPEAKDLKFNLSQKAVNESSSAFVDKSVCDIERKNQSGNPIPANENLTDSSEHGCLTCVVHSLTCSEKKKKRTSAGQASFSSSEPIC